MQIVERTARGLIIDGIVDREVRARNFAGKEKKDPVTGRTVNSEGYRNFLLFIPEDIAEELKAKGCEVKYTKVKDPNDEPMPYVSITVSYYIRPVEACLISNNNPTMLDEAHMYTLDNVDFKNVCIEVEFGREKTHLNGAKYIPIFLQKIYAQIVPSYFNEKYGHLNNPAPEAPSDVSA